jgi:hypothetical protein
MRKETADWLTPMLDESDTVIASPVTCGFGFFVRFSGGCVKYSQ